jgi:hypothetical protein
MKKLFLFLIILFIMCFRIYGQNTTTVKSNDVSVGLYKVNSKITIEYVMLNDIDEAMIYSYQLQTEEMERKDVELLVQDLESELYIYCRTNCRYINKRRKYYSYKILKTNIHYNVTTENSTKKFVVFEARVLFKN